jgi:hypothetical protein
MGGPPKKILQKSRKTFCCIENTPTFAPPIETGSEKEEERKRIAR